jgi:hemolysin III
MTATPLDGKPSWRGVLHQFAAPMALGAGLVLVAIAPTLRAQVAVAIFAASLVTLFTVSATYHRVTWSAVARDRMRRMDHSSIFVLIAGTYTPLALLGLPDGTSLLVTIWCMASLGIVQSLFFVKAPKWVAAVLALAVGWTIVPWVPTVYAALSATELTLIAIGGVAYSSGALAYAFKRPNPKPGVFGYHEVFHALTIIGASAHFVMVLLLVRRTR